MYLYEVSDDTVSGAPETAPIEQSVRHRLPCTVIRLPLVVWPLPVWG